MRIVLRWLVDDKGLWRQNPGVKHARPARHRRARSLNVELQKVFNPHPPTAVMITGRAASSGMRIRMFKLLTAWAVSVFVLLGAAAPAGQTSRPYALYRVNVAGAKRIPAAAVVRMTGLKANTQVTTLDVERARQRLIDSGLFSSVGYRFSMAGYSLIVSFDVEEPPWDARVLLDNFVWFTDDELTRAIARELPTFAGYAPSLPRSLLRVTRALQQYLDGAGIKGTVSYVAASGGDSTVTAYRFRVHLPTPLTVCAVELEGVSPLMAVGARDRVKFVVGQDYSREFVARGMDVNLLPFFLERGFARAGVTAIRARPAPPDDAGCAGGVRVTVAVHEGVAYSFAGARWSGHEEVQGSDLDNRLGLRPGALLNMQVFDAGLQAVRDEYSRQGYIVARTTYTFSFDDEARTAAAAITIVRGPQARMGLLEIAGLPDEAAARLRESWSLAQGAIYDGTYVRDFLKAARGSFPAVFKEFPNVSVKVDFRDGVGIATVSLTFAREGRES